MQIRLIHVNASLAIRAEVTNKKIPTSSRSRDLSLSVESKLNMIAIYMKLELHKIKKT